MSEYTTGNPQPPEFINSPKEHPLKNFVWMLATLGIILAIIFLVVTLAADKLAPLVPFSWEPKITLNAEESLQDEAHQEALASLKTLGQALAEKSDLPEDMDVTFHLMDMPEANAFATLGGQIYVTTGLLSAVDSENALSMVIAHEIAHIKHRDPIRSAGRGVLINIVLGALGLSDNSAALQTLVMPSATMTQLSYGRKMETNADASALTTLAAYYGHVNGSQGFFKGILNERAEKKYMEWFSSHPMTQNRIDAINEHAQVQGLNLSGELTPMSEALLVLQEATE